MNTHKTLMRKGTVKFYNVTKGFGFIIDDETKEEYYVRSTGLIDSIRENDVVEFELTDGRKGPNAINVKTA